MIKQYSAISKYYDRLMSDYPYESVLQWVKLNAHGRGIEIGTGTGKIAIELTKSGLKTVGLDQSEEMLSVAMQNARAACAKTVFVHADVREYEFFPCDFVLAPCDVFNYLTEDDDLVGVVENVYDALSDGGVLLFDLSTAQKLAGESGTYLQDYDDLTVVWDNTFDGTLAELNLLVFEKDGNGYSRRDEHHVQRAYDTADVVDLLQDVGFSVQLFDHNFVPTKDGKGADRVFFVAKK